VFEKRKPFGILPHVLAGFVLVLGGGLIAYSSRQDWLVANLPPGKATLHMTGSHLGHALLFLGAVIIALGIARILRGYAEDRGLHRLATIVSLVAIVTALVRFELFLSDQTLSLGFGSYGRLDLRSGSYLFLSGVVLTFCSRFA